MQALALVASFFTLVIVKDSNEAGSFRKRLQEQLGQTDILRPVAQDLMGPRGGLRILWDRLTTYDQSRFSWHEQSRRFFAEAGKKLHG